MLMKTEVFEQVSKEDTLENVTEPWKRVVFSVDGWKRIVLKIGSM